MGSQRLGNSLQSNTKGWCRSDARLLIESPGFRTSSARTALQGEDEQSTAISDSSGTSSSVGVPIPNGSPAGGTAGGVEGPDVVSFLELESSGGGIRGGTVHENEVVICCYRFAPFDTADGGFKAVVRLD